MMPFAYRVRKPEPVLTGWFDPCRSTFCQREYRNPVFTLRQRDIERSEPALGGIDQQFEFAALTDGRGRPLHRDGGSGAAPGKEPHDDESDGENDQNKEFP